MTTEELYWLAGILEGEGSFLCAPPSSPNTQRISCQMTDEDVIARVASLFGVKHGRINRRQEAHHKLAWIVQVKGRKALALMKALRPIMGNRRQQQIDRALNDYDPSRERIFRESTRKVTPEMVDSAKKRIEAGESLRSIARSFSICHNTLKSRIVNGIPYIADTTYSGVVF